MEAPIKAGGQGAIITGFFSQSMLVKRKKKANCVAAPGFLGGGDECVSAEKTSSRWRTCSWRCTCSATPDGLGQAAGEGEAGEAGKLFFAEVEKLKKASTAGNAKEAALRYALAKEALDVYLNDVELPPTFVPGETSRPPT